MSEQHLIEVKNLCKYFPAGKKRTLKAVDNVSLFIRPGETLGLVGESGCGKTTCGRTILKLYNQTSGQIFFEGKEISHLKGKELLQFKKNAQMIFQDPYSSLDPRMTIAEIIAEGIHHDIKFFGHIFIIIGNTFHSGNLSVYGGNLYRDIISCQIFKELSAFLRIFGILPNTIAGAFS